MRSETTGILGGLVASAAAIAIALVVFAPSPSSAVPEGVAWQDTSLDAALARARAEHKRVLVKFDATWCHYCKQLAHELLDQREGGAAAQNLVAVRFDFDAPANRALVERFVIMELPTVLVLDEHGEQVGRIVGYDGKADWLAKLRAAETAEDPVPALRAAVAATPDDSHALYALGEALLVRGQRDEGETLLERTAWTSTPDAAHALYLLGRYHQRVRRDSRTARHIWRELATRFPESEWAAGAWWWHGKAAAEVGRVELGLAALRARVAAHPGSADAVGEWAQYVQAHDLARERQAAHDALVRVIPSAPAEDRADLEELARELATARPLAAP